MSKTLIIVVAPPVDHECFKIATFDVSTGKKVFRYIQEINDLLNFFDELPEFVKTSVKGVVCGFLKYGTIDHDFSEKVATKINALKIPFRLISDLYINAMCAFIGAKIDPEVDKEFLQIFVKNEIFTILSFSRRNDGYVLKDVRETPQNFDHKVLCGSSKITKVIFSNFTEFFEVANCDTLHSTLSGKGICVLKEDVSEFFFDAVKELVDHMYNLESSKKYFIIPQSSDEFGVTALGMNPSEKDILLKIKEKDNLPATNSIVIPRFHKKFYITAKSKGKLRILQGPHEINEVGHRYKLTLSVDFNNYPMITHEAVILSRIKKLPKKLKTEKTEKLPIIGFFDNASVICIWNEVESCYKFLDSWNGKFGKDLFLDFLLPKPAIVSSSTDVTSLAGAVYDLIKIMSMPSNDITVYSNWKFTFTKDDDNPVLLEFDTIEKSRKQASPAFLIAMMLKKHRKAIKKEMGEKPTKLGFRLLDEFENPEAKKRVEAGLKEACEMIKVGFLLL